MHRLHTMPDNQFVTLAEASKLLAVSTAQIYRMAARGALGPIKRTYPRQVKIEAIETLAGPISQAQLDRARKRPRVP